MQYFFAVLHYSDSRNVMSPLVKASLVTKFLKKLLKDGNHSRRPNYIARLCRRNVQPNSENFGSIENTLIQFTKVEITLQAGDVYSREMVTKFPAPHLQSTTTVRAFSNT